MRIAIWAFVIVLAGVALGAAASWPDLRRLNWPAEDLVSAKARNLRMRADPMFNPNLPHPRAIASETKFDFGEMERGGKQSHGFVIKNEGDAPLTLTKGKTSCKCTLSGLDKDSIAPGEKATVTLDWSAETDRPVFHQSATILTNDPGRPELTFEVDGKIVQHIRLEPSQLAVSKIAGETKSYEVRVVSVNFDNLRIVGNSFEDPSTAKYIDVSYRTLTPEELNTSGEAESAIKGGALVTVTLKPGLPLGLVLQRIRLATNLEQQPEVILPVAATIEGDISVVGGREWNGSRMLLSLGVLKASHTTRRELTLLVRGAAAGKVELHLDKVTPEGIRVQIGQSREISGGRVQRIPLTIEIPSGMRPVALMGKNQGGYGEIVLSTNHPEIGELRLKLQLAIER